MWFIVFEWIKIAYFDDNDDDDGNGGGDDDDDDDDDDLSAESVITWGQNSQSFTTCQKNR